MNPAPTIRRLVPSDAAAYQQLRLMALAESPTAFGSSVEAESGLPLSLIASQMETHSGRQRFGAFDGERLVGLVGVGRESALKTRHKGYIGGVYVRPDQRGKGLGRQLMQAALAGAATMEGVRQLSLNVTANNTSAIALYASLGFTAYGREPNALLVDQVMYDNVLMVYQVT